jgi:hypothetical protein
MKQYIFIIILIITIIVFYISLIPIKESIVSTIPDNDVIIVDSSESLRDLLAKMYYNCMLDSNTPTKDGDMPTVCYKINRLFGYFEKIKDLFDDKTEEEIMNVYGYKPIKTLAGQDVGEKPPFPIIGSNEDYVNLIKLFTYGKMLKPYNDLKIWSKNDNVVTSHCSYNDSESNAFVKCADNMLIDIAKLLKYFQYQVDKTEIRYDGDSKSTGTGTGTLVNTSSSILSVNNTPVSITPPPITNFKMPNLNIPYFKMPM